MRELKPTNHAYAHLLSYRTYRLQRQRELKNLKSSMMRNNLDNLRIHVGDLTFYLEDPILLLDFLAVYASQADKLESTEHEAYLSLPKCLSKNALIHYRASIQISLSDSRAVRG